MKKFSNIFRIFVIVSVLISCNFGYANPYSEDGILAQNVAIEDTSVVTDGSRQGNALNISQEDVEKTVDKAADTVSNLAYTIVYQISDKCLPVCAIFILWGAVMYFIMGIRNLYKKRQGLLLMWGAFTFVVIAKIVNFVFWFALVR